MSALVGCRDVFLGESLPRSDSDMELELARSTSATTISRRSGKYLDSENNPIRPPTPRTWDTLELKDYVPWVDDNVLADSADPLEKERLDCVKAIDEQSRKLFNERSSSRRATGSKLEKSLDEVVPMSPQYRPSLREQPSVSQSVCVVPSKSAGTSCLSARPTVAMAQPASADRRVDASETKFSSEHQGGAKIKIKIQRVQGEKKAKSVNETSNQCVRQAKRNAKEEIERQLAEESLQREEMERKRAAELQLLQQRELELKRIAEANLAQLQEMERKRFEEQSLTERKIIDEELIEQQQQNEILQAIIKHLEEMEEESIAEKECDQPRKQATEQVSIEMARRECKTLQQSSGYCEEMFHRNSKMHKVKYAAKRQSITDNENEKNPSDNNPSAAESSSSDYTPVIPNGKRRVAHRSTQHILTCRSVLGITKPPPSNNVLPSGVKSSASSSSQKPAASSKSSSKPKPPQQPKNKLKEEPSSRARVPRVKSSSVDGDSGADRSRTSSFDKSPVYGMRRESQGSSESLDSNGNYKMKGPFALLGLSKGTSASSPLSFVEAHRYLIPSSHVHGNMTTDKLMMPNFSFFEHMTPTPSTASESSNDSLTHSDAKLDYEAKKITGYERAYAKREISEVDDVEDSLLSISCKKRKPSNCDAEDEKTMRKNSKKERIKSLFY